MDSQDQRVVVSKILDVVRKTARLVKIFPFAYLVVYVVFLASDLLSFDYLTCLIDSLFVVTPAVSLSLIVLSRIFGLCNWHKAACLIPVTSDFESYIDTNIIQFTQDELVIISSIMIISVCMFIVLAYKYLLGHGRKRAC